MTGVGPDWRERLTEFMETRQLELAESWQEIADRAGMSATNLRRIRNGQSELLPRTEGKLERGFRWASRSVAAIRRGEAPTLLPLNGPDAIAGPSDGPRDRLAAGEPVSAIHAHRLLTRALDAGESNFWELLDLLAADRHRLQADGDVTAGQG